MRCYDGISIDGICLWILYGEYIYGYYTVNIDGIYMGNLW